MVHGRASIDGAVAPSTLAGGLNWLDRRLGDPWSIQALRTSLGLALIYCWIAFFLGWGLGGSGRIGEVALLADPQQPARLAGALSAILLPLATMLVGRFLGRMERRAKLSLIRRLRRRPGPFRRRLRVADFERRYRWVLGLTFGAALVAVLIWLRRGDVAAFTILFSWLALGPVSGIAMARRFAGPIAQGLAALAAGFGSLSGAVLLILAFAGAGVSAFAFAILGVTNVAFAGAIGVLLDLVMGGAFTLGLALAGAGIATVALALAGAGTGIATLTGVATMSRAGLAAFILLMGGATLATLAFDQAAVLAAAIGGISALAVAAAVSHNRRGRHGAYAGAIGAIALMTAAAVALGWGDRPLVVFAVCFFFLLPLVNGLIDWIAWAALRTLFRRLHAGRPGWRSTVLSGIAGFGIAAVAIAALAFALGLGFESYNQLTVKRTGEAAFALLPAIEQAVRTPWGEGLWLGLMLATPLLPIVFFGGGLLSDGLLALRPSGHAVGRWLFVMTGMALTGTAFVLLVRLITVSDLLDPAEALAWLARLGVAAADGPTPPA